MVKRRTWVNIHGIVTDYPVKEFGRLARQWSGLTAARGAGNPFTVVYQHPALVVLECAKHPGQECAVIEIGA